MDPVYDESTVKVLQYCSKCSLACLDSGGTPFQIGLTLAFQGLLNPLFAAGIHVVSQLIFILNSARLIR
ncbi:MAG TPA: hypothetical protein VFV92_13735 [Candidatus Bathyarchaeia archaeon]|nr:hypothetical protein [Candidatus Bathyarchaeia archaeon]